MEDEQNDEESEDDDDDEESVEEFLEKYAQAASALENGIVEEGDAEDQDLEIELGSLEEVDQQRIVLSLIGRYHHALIRGQLYHLSLFPTSLIPSPTVVRSSSNPCRLYREICILNIFLKP
ncbi:hypothetical protein CRYUN_Cryun36dG0108400 [Craigia yunnanensis]